MISDAEFELFLKSNDRKVTLVELDCWDGSQEVTLYGSDKGYNTNLSPGVEHRPYTSFVNKLPSKKQSLASGSRSGGEIVIDNSNGIRDSWIHTYKFDGRQVVFKYGSPNWEYADFRQVGVNIVESRYSRKRDEITLKLRDPEAYLDFPLQPSLVTTGPNTGERLPVGYGLINSAPAVLIDPVTHKYQIHDAEIEQIVAVQDDRVDVASFTPSIIDGTFTLGAQPAGNVTCTFKGAKVGGVFLEKAGEIIDHIITTRTNLPGGLYDSAAFIALDAAIDWKHNIFVDDGETARQVIEKILGSMGAKLIRARDGKISVARLTLPSVSADQVIRLDDVKKNQFKPVKVQAPWIRARLGYAKNYSVATNLDTSLTEAERAAAKREYSIVSASNAIAALHPLAVEPELIETTLTEEAAATARLTEEMALRAVERFVYELIMYASVFLFKVGDTVQLFNPRFGFAAGKNALVYSQDDATTNGTSRVEIWL